jgi:hypothetical protein
MAVGVRRSYSAKRSNRSNHFSRDRMLLIECSTLGLVGCRLVNWRARKEATA